MRRATLKLMASRPRYPPRFPVGTLLGEAVVWTHTVASFLLFTPIQVVVGIMQVGHDQDGGDPPHGYTPLGGGAALDLPSRGPSPSLL